MVFDLQGIYIIYLNTIMYYYTTQPFFAISSTKQPQGTTAEVQLQGDAGGGGGSARMSQEVLVNGW